MRNIKIHIKEEYRVRIYIYKILNVYIYRYIVYMWQGATEN